MDDSFWKHVEKLQYSICIPVSDTRSMDVMQVLYDIYECINEDPKEARSLVISMAAILIASHDGIGDQMWEDLVVDKAKQDMDKVLKEILNEKS